MFPDDLYEQLVAINQEDAVLLEGISEVIFSSEGRRIGDMARGLIRTLEDPDKGMLNISEFDYEQAYAWGKILILHPAATKERRLKIIVNALGEGNLDAVPRQDAVKILVAGSLALGLQNGSDASLQDALIHVAFGADAVSLLLRRVFTNRLDLWDPTDPIAGLQDALKLLPVFSCVPGILNAVIRTAIYFREMRAAAEGVTVTEAGISGLNPNRGSGGDEVVIQGTFQTPQPPGMGVLFPKAGGGCIVAAVKLGEWKADEIKVIVPEPVGEGPVGFFTRKNSGARMSIDFGAPLDFTSQLMECIGPVAALLAGRVSSIVPGLLGEEKCPSLRFIKLNSVNMFYGGPILDSIDRDWATERDANPIIISGRNLSNSDLVEVGGVVCRTKFISSIRLEMVLPAIPAGLKPVFVRRGKYRSNRAQLGVRATVDGDSLSLGRLDPGKWFSITGTGFDKDRMQVYLNEEAANIEVIDTHSLRVQSFRPVQHPPPANRHGEDVSVTISDYGHFIGTTTLKLNIFRIAVFGDSVVWGQGLRERDKFTSLVARHIWSELGGRVGVYAEDRLAHSGAVIKPSPLDWDVDPELPVLDITGEIPKGRPTITAQVAAWNWQAKADPNNPKDLKDLREQAMRIQLVIMDGGGNDVGIFSILDPLGNDQELLDAIQKACNTDMQVLLQQVVNTFRNAKVIVTGYYPVISLETDSEKLFKILSNLGLLGANSDLFGWAWIPMLDWLVGRLTTRSNLFAYYANSALALAASMVGPQVSLAVPKFGPDNAFEAPDSYIWDLQVVDQDVLALDPVAEERREACKNKPGTDWTCPIASFGHPNPRGAQAYFEAIKPFLPSSYQF